MAINLLLDTCVLNELVSPTEFSGYLRQIIFWNERGEVKVYCPKKLLEEWEVHRKKKLAKIDSILKNHVAKIKMGNLFNIGIEIDDEQLSAADKLLKSQVEAIDKLLSESIAVKDGQAPTTMWNHKQQGKAPFRVKGDSDNDAMILFSTIEEILAQNHNELYFFSSNYTDYSAIGHSDEIHPDIIESYPDIIIKYYKDYVKGINDLIKLGLPSSRKELHTIQPKALITLDKSQPIGSQIHSYLTKKFADIDYLPKHLFVDHYPFVIGKKELNAKSQAFTLETDNPEVFGYFKNILEVFKAHLENNSSQIADQEAIDIVNHLRSCHIHKIYFKHKVIDLPHINSKKCTCLNCRYRNSEFTEVFQNIPIDVDIESVTLKDAFLRYKLGQIETAVDILNAIVLKAKKNKKWITYYIANYNLSLIGKMFRFGTSEEQNLPWVPNIETIVMEDKYIESRTVMTDDILNYLEKTSFMSTAISSAAALALKIKNDYLDKLRGWNSNTRDLLSLYFETMGFIENNYLMIDYFSDVNTMTYHFVDGLFASYKCHKELGGKLLHFTDPIVKYMILYSKSDDIVKCRIRYDISIAEYETEHRSLASNLVKLLQSYEFVREHFSNSISVGQRFFWKQFRTQFHNSVTLAAILEIDAKEINEICAELIDFLRIETHFQEYEIAKTVSYFVTNNVNLIEKRYLEELLHFAYTAENVQREVYIHTISNVSRIEHVELKVNEEEWEILKSRYLVYQELDKDITLISELCCMFDFLKDLNFKNEIAVFFTDYLKFKYNSEVYYTAAIHRIIAPTKKMNKLYDDDMLKLASEGRRPRIFEKSYYSSTRIDQYINFKFCFNLSFSNEFVNAVIKLDSYYKWILDLEEFDYSDFNSDWLFNHLTKYYKRRFRESQTLRYWMRKNAIETKSLQVNRFFIELYTD